MGGCCCVSNIGETMYTETMNNLFFNAYVTAALWSSTNNNDEPLDGLYSENDFDRDSLEKMRVHALKFFTDNIDLINSADNYSYEQAGHDLWLTENGHGAGFWDRGLNDIGDKLTEIAGDHVTDIYVGDDGRLYA